MQPIPFKDMNYCRPDLPEVKTSLSKQTGKLKSAPSYADARKIFLREQELESHVKTMETLAKVRHAIDTRDEFYDQEESFWNAALPQLKENLQAWNLALLESRFRPDFSAEFGELMFLKTETEMKTFSPEIISELQQEAELKTRYNKLIASAQIPFAGALYTISQMSPFKNDPDDAMRLSAWKAEGKWYRENQEELDDIYDRLVHLRDRMGKKMGCGGYIPLGYYRMERICYGRQEAENFRDAVRRYIVPAAEKICRERADRLGFPYPMSYADAQLGYRCGNPKPAGGPDEILKAGDRFYDELSPETGVFFRTMRANGLMDVLSTEGKRAGGFCTMIGDYKVPFIFANFNGTQHDVEVVTHEAGHAFAAWQNRNRIPLSDIWPGMEACEVHSMSMEFFAWPWAEDFFGKDADRFRYSHLASALTFIPYGTMVDHFQHIIYEKPEMTPKERHSVWKELIGMYQPWLRLDGEIPFYSDGEGWQRQQHIYNSPFYYIDYCLAQTVALEFWAMIQENRSAAWDKYMAFTAMGGSETFTALLEKTGLGSPFDKKVLSETAGKALAWLEEHHSLCNYYE